MLSSPELVTDAALQGVLCCVRSGSDFLTKAFLPKFGHPAFGILGSGRIGREFRAARALQTWQLMIR